MSDVIHKTTMEIKESVNTPDYPAGTWLINPTWNPDKATIKAVVQAHRKITGSTAEEMTAQEKLDNPLPIVDKAQPKPSKIPVRAATAEELPAATRSGGVFTADANGAMAQVGAVTLALQDRFLDKDNVTGADQGIMILTQIGDGSTPAKWQRASDAVDGELQSCAMVLVEEGDDAGLAYYLTTANPITVNTTAQTWEVFPAI